MNTVQTVLRSRYGVPYMTVLEGDRTDAVIMMELAELRQQQDEIDEELRDPESAVSGGYVYIAGERPCPTAAYHVHVAMGEDGCRAAVAGEILQHPEIV